MKNITLFIFLIIIAGNIKAAENREQIAVIDTGVSFSQSTSNEVLCENGRKSMFRDSGLDRNGHGRNIIGIISKKINIKKQCIVSYKVWKDGTSEKSIIKNTIDAIKDAISRNVKYINISMGGDGFNSREFEVVRKALNKGITIIVASGNGDEITNRGIDLDKNCRFFPACYRDRFPHKNFHVVSTVDLLSSNYGSVVTDKVFGSNISGGGVTLSGTSQATAVVTSNLISTEK